MSKKVAILLLILSILSQYTFGFYVYAVEPQIVIDGKTATNLEQKGKITDIKTATIKEGNALNSFRRFNVNQDHIVNLYLPDNVGNLVNLVHEETSYINGILNSIKNNEIGGNVYFLNPHGIMVGAQGTVNVGSLTAVTPTSEFMNSVFTSPGEISSSSMNMITGGNIPVTDSGLITVAGEINAINDINLEAGDIVIAASENTQGIVNTGAAYSENEEGNRDKVNFSDVVNTGSVESGEQITADGGEIKIIAANDVINDGIVAADGTDDVDGGSVTVEAGNDVYLHSDSQISARGRGDNSDGGDVIVYAGRKARFDQGAVLDVRGGEVSGDGGFIELSAKETVALKGGQFKASAEEGQAGSVLIDPENILIDYDLHRDGSSFGNFDGEFVQYFYGANFKLEASASITVGEDVVISTRDLSYFDHDHVNDYSKGDSGNLELNAPQITLNSGSKLLAHVINEKDADGVPKTDYKAGNITLTASKVDTPAALAADASSSIMVNDAMIKGKDVTMSAASTADYSWDYDDPADNLVQTGAAAVGVGTGFNVGYAKANGSSAIVITGNTTIEAEGKVDLLATTDSTTSITTLSGGNSVAGVAFAYGDLDATATIDIGDGVQLSSGELKLMSRNNATLDINAMGITETADYEAGIAVTYADVNSSAVIADGARINTGNLTISAVNNNSFSTKATSMALEDAKAGVGAAIFTADTAAVASYSGDYLVDSTGTGNMHNLTIEALDNTSENITMSSATTGTSALLKPIIGGVNSGVNFVKNKLGATPGFDSASGTKHWKLAGAVSYSDTSQSVEAFIGDNTEVSATGDIAISARVRDDKVQNRAVSDVESQAPGEGSTATVALSAAIAYGDYDHTAKAYTGDNSILTADHLGLRSHVIKPYEKDWNKWDTVEDVAYKIGDVLGYTTDGYITGYANAIGSAEDVNIAGAAAYLDFNNNSQAYTGRGSEIHLQDDNDWTTILPGAAELDNLPTGFSSLQWDTPLHIAASTEINGVYAAGNIFAILPGLGGGEKSVGGGYNQVNYSNNTEAYLAEGTVVEGQEVATEEDSESGEGSGEEEEVEPVFYKPDITINADGKENVITVSPTAGTGATWGFNGTFSLVNIDNTTTASIDDNALLKTGNIDIEARDEIIDWSLSGAVNLSENIGVGAGIAINKVDTDTRAYVGDNDKSYNVQQGDTLSELAQKYDTTVEKLKEVNELDSDTIYVDQELDIPYNAGQIEAASMDIDARTEGSVDTIAVAGAGVYKNDTYQDADDGDSSTGILSKMKNKLPGFGSKLKDKTGSEEEKPAEPEFGLGISGSFAYNQVNLDTSAYAADSILKLNGTNSSTLNLHAINNTDITAASGAGAFIMANNKAALEKDSKYSVGIAGSVAVNDLTNTTSAYGDNVNIEGADNVDLKALSAGEALAVGIGVTINATTDQSKAAGIAGSVSANMTANDTEAYLLNSSVTGNNDEEEDNSLELTAYDRSKLGTGAGSLLGDGKLGIGTAVSYSSINNNINSYLQDTTVTYFDRVQIHGLNSTRIGSGAGMMTVAVADDSATLSGSFVINEINNYTKSEIKNSEITVTEEIDLLAKDTDGEDSLDEIINSDTENEASDIPAYDYNGSDWLDDQDTDTAGSSILSGAGLLQGSDNNIGLSLAWNDISNDFTASVNDSALETTAVDSNINVRALSRTDITTMALGGGVALGKFAGAGSVVINDSGNNTVAKVDTDRNLKSSNLNIEAVDNSNVNSMAGQITVSMGGAIGGGLVFNDIDGNTEAFLNGGSETEKLKLGSLNIDTAADQIIKGYALQGSGGVKLAAGAAYVENIVNHNLISEIKEGSYVAISGNDNHNITTVDNIDIKTEAEGYNIGTAAVGAVLGISRRTGDTTASIGGKSDVEHTAEDTEITVSTGQFNIKSDRSGVVESFTRAGAGGVYSGSGSYAEADETGKVEAGLGNNVVLQGLADVNITAAAKPHTSAVAEGLNLAVKATAGASIAKANADLDIEAAIAGGGQVRAGSLSVKALNDINDEFNSDSNHTAYSSAIAASGGGLLGLNATKSTAKSNSTVITYIDSSIYLRNNLDIIATNNTKQEAKVTGITAGGAAAIGGNMAEASSDSVTVAAVGRPDMEENENIDDADKEVNIDGSNINIVFDRYGYNSQFTLKATGNDYNKSDAIAGSGGLIAGAAAFSETDSNSQTIAEIGNGAVIGKYTGTGPVSINNKSDVLSLEGDEQLNRILNLQKINVLAEHHTIFNSTSNSVQAAVGGMSGSHSTNEIDASVEANVGQDAEVDTRNYNDTGINIVANNIIDQAGSDKANAKAAAGGVVNGSAANSKTYVTQDTAINIGDNTQLLAYGSPVYNNSVSINAFNSLYTDDEAILSTGGVVQAPFADTLLKAGDDSREEDSDGQHYIKADVNIGVNSRIISFGKLDIGAYTHAQSSNTALVKTYGGVASAGGTATTLIDSSQQINLADNSYLMAYHDVELRAGEKGDGSVYNKISTDARADVYNYTAVPMETSISAYAETTNSSHLTIADTARIEGARNIVLNASKGLSTAEGYGEGHNPYLESVGSKKTGGDDKNTSYAVLNMEGQASAGVFNRRYIEFNSDGSLRNTVNLKNNIYNYDTINPSEQLQNRIDQLKWEKQYASEAEASRLQGKIDVLTMLKNFLSAGDKQAIEIDNLFAAGGNISIDAEIVSGNGDLYAYGDPSIEIVNNSSKYLILNQLLIPDDDTGGSIEFTGVVDRASAGFNLNENKGSGSTEISIQNTSNSGEPAIFLKQGVYNRRGLVDIYNKDGSVAQFDVIRAKETNISAANGAVIVNNPEGMFNTNADPIAAWYQYENLPSSAWETAEYVANAMYEEEGFGRYINGWLRDFDSNDRMYPSDQDYAEAGGKTYVFGDIFPNEQNEDLGSVKLFNNFWMKRVYSKDLDRSFSTYPDGFGEGEDAAIAGQVVGINADRININGKIRAGSPVSWDIDLKSSIDDWLKDKDGSGTLTIPEEYYLVRNETDEIPELKYDFNQDKLILDDINASGGGYVYLNGRIMSTNTQGEIEVLHGLGNVDIDNYSSKPLLLNNINTGTTAEGVIKIVDTLKNETTWYVNSPDNNIKKYQSTGTDNRYKPGYYETLSPGEASYSPEEGLRYQWIREAEIYRDLFGADGYVGLKDETKDSRQDWFYDYTTHLNPWRWQGKSGTNVTDGHWQTVSDGIYVDKNNNTVFDQEITGDVTEIAWGKKYIDEDGNTTYRKHYGPIAVGFSDTSKGVPDGVWYYYLPTEAELTVTNSIKADNDIAINFSGSADANLEISSDPGLTLAGRIDNPLGDTLLMTKFIHDDYKGNITQHSSTVINTHNLTIASDSNIGTTTRPVVINLSGDLAAVSNNGDINMKTDADTVNIDRIYSGTGAVNFEARGDIVNNSSNVIIGGDMNLISKQGQIGTAANSFKINADGNVTLQAKTDINLTQQEGDLLLEKAYSSNGDLTLTVNEGRIVDAIRGRAVDEEKQQELAYIWDRLHLSAEHDALNDAEKTTITPYERRIERAYDQYWYLLENGELDEEGDYQLDQEAIDLYRPRVGQDATDEDVMTYAENKFMDHRNLLDENLGEDWQQAGYQSDFNYILTDNPDNDKDKWDELTEGAVWSKNELEIQINRNALVSESTQFVGGDLNLKAENINLLAGDSIGTYKEPLVIDLNSARFKEEGLTEEEAAVLTAANLPGDIKVTKDENGEPALITIRRLRPIYANPLKSISTDNDNGNTFIYNSEGSLNINQVNSSGDLRLLARDDIINYNLLNDYAINAADDSSAVVLEAANGSIGTETAPLILKNGYIATGRAKNNIYLEKTASDLSFNRISAENIVNLSSPGHIEGLQSGLSIFANTINFNAGGNISGKGFANSSDDNSLQIELKTGKLTAQAGGSINLSSEKSITTGVVEAGNVKFHSNLLINIGDRMAAADIVHLDGSDIYEIGAGEDRGYITTETLTTVTDWGQQLYGDNEIKIIDVTNNIEGDIGLTNTGELNVREITQNIGDVNIINDGDLTITGMVTVEDGDVDLEAAGSITETETGKILKAHSLSTTSTGGQLLNGDNTIKAFTAVNNDRGNIVLNNITEHLIVENIKQSAAADVKVANKGSIDIDEISLTNGTAHVSAAVSITNRNNTETANITAVDIDLTADRGSIGAEDNYLIIDSSSPVTGTVNADAGEDIYLREIDGNMNIGQFNAVRDIELIADLSILNSNDTENSNFTAEKITLVAQNGSIGKTDNHIKTSVGEITEAVAAKGIYLVELGGNLDSQIIRSKTGSVDLLAPDGDIKTAYTEAAAAIKMSGTGNMSADSLKAKDLELLFTNVDKSVTINQADIEETVDIVADNIEIEDLTHITTGSTGPLLLSIKGGSRELADNVNITGSSDSGFDFQQFRADFARVEAAADNVNFLNTIVGSRAELYNNYYSVIADNINRKLFACDLQLYPRDQEFYLLFRADRKMLTDAMVVNYNPDFIANEFSTENSFIRQIAKLTRLTNFNNSLFTTGLNNSSVLLLEESLIKNSSEGKVNMKNEQ